MKTLADVMRLSPEDFFTYVASIRYGYKDRSGALHFQDDAGFAVKEYVLSSCEEVVTNNRAWCWEIAELTKLYCTQNGIPHHAWFMEYRSKELHQTHTQVFMLYRGMWCPTPDNCLGIRLGEHGFVDLEESVRYFTGLFTDYLKATLHDRYDQSKLFLKEYVCDFLAGITDDAYLEQIRR